MNKQFSSWLTTLALFSSLLASLLPWSATAVEYHTGWLSNPQHPPVEVRYMLTGQNDPKAKTVEALLEVQLDTGWKTYWRSPGESGVAPSIDWGLSANLDNVDWHWPVPKRYEFLGVETLGYKEHIVFPMTLHIGDMNKPVFLSGKLTMSSCTNVCVLTDYEIALNFTPTKLSASQEAMHLYNQGMSQVPKLSQAITLDHLSWDANNQTLSVIATNPQGWQQPDLFIDGHSQQANDASFRTPSIRIEGDKMIAQMKVTSWFGTPKLLNQTLNATISDNGIAVEMPGMVTDLPLPVSSQSHLFDIIAIALLGGLILNVMPCVLPVLGIKLSSIISANALQQRQIRAQFLASAAGILTSFWLLAGFLTLMKLSGQALGWGVQFQSPYFISAMVLITGLFAANMFGLLEIQLPSNTNTWLATRGDNSYTGHFIQGMFATLLATPCSAPFLGTAVAFALGSDVITLIAIFTALAVGMAAPWLIIAVFPSLAKLLPPPGPWMNKLKTLFGLMMLATSLWLLSLMTHFISLWLVTGIGTLLMVALLWRLGRLKGRKPVILALACLVFGAAGSLIVGSITADQWAKPLPSDHNWQPLDTQRLELAVSQGKTVFVDVTADWCITCKANKIGVLLQEPVYSTLGEENIVLMRGDWTRPSEYVTGYLQSNGRFGVPFNIVYGPGSPAGSSLPVILNSADVIKAINTASEQE